MLKRVRCNLRGIVAAVIVPAILMVPAIAAAQGQTFGAKVSIDSSGKVEVNNVTVYNPEPVMYADSGQIQSDATTPEDDEAWYSPTPLKFFVGLAAIGVCVGLGFVIDNNIDDDDDDGYWYYDPDCDCYRYHH